MVLFVQFLVNGSEVGLRDCLVHECQVVDCDLEDDGRQLAVLNGANQEPNHFFMVELELTHKDLIEVGRLTCFLYPLFDIVIELGIVSLKLGVVVRLLSLNR